MLFCIFRRLAEKRKELRKEKSKEAARNRRGKEGEFFAELADTLPLANSLKQSLDKSTVIKLCINYMRLRELLQGMLANTLSFLLLILAGLLFTWKKIICF